MRFTEYLDETHLVEARPQRPDWQQPGDKVNMPHNFAKGKYQTPRQAKDAPFQTLLKLATNRDEAAEMDTLLTSMYAAKKSNPQVQMTVPQLVRQSPNRNTMMQLFNLAKDQDLAGLAAMSQEIRKAAASGSPQNQRATGGMTAVPPTPGQTPAQKTMLQKLLNMIQQAAKSLTPNDMEIAKRQLDRAARMSKPNPMNEPELHNKNKAPPVVTQG